MAVNSAAFAIAVEHLQAGRLEAADAVCREILAVDSNDVDALHLLGVIASRLGRHEFAVECISRAIALKGTDPVFLANLGAVFRDVGKLDEAVECCLRALQLKPDHAAAYYNLGNALLAQGKLDEGVDSYRRALELKPDLIEAHNNLGTAFLAQGKVEEAVACCCRAMELNPNDVVAHYNLGATFQTQGRLDDAVRCFQRALELKPDFPEAYYNLGNTLQAQGKVDDAIASYRRAVQQKPDYEVAHYNLGTALQALGKLDEAAACFRRTLELNPDHAAAHNNLGAVLHEQRKLDEAAALYRRALELKPDYAEAWCNVLLGLHYQASTTPSELSAAHAEFDRLEAAPRRVFWRPHENARDPERPLRLGFVAPAFGLNPVGFFLVRALENLNRSQWETVLYCDQRTKDDMTARFEAAATIWRDVGGLGESDLADVIRADRIDILFDLAGHSAKERMLVFARKPAPIQVTWAGYMGTTGLQAMDYILADRYEIPPQAEIHYRERVLRMPDGYVTYDPPPYAPLVSPLPALQQGAVTLGSFNKPAKINSSVVAVWAKILNRVPQSRLLLKYRGMNYDSIANSLAMEFAGHGIDPRRVECHGWSQHQALLAEYDHIDLALDPFPYNGGLTTCEALWMGVPVITCPGETFAGRHSLSHLYNVGLAETIARDLDDYVELAVSLANDLPRLAALRVGLRERMAASPLCDGKRFAENLMTVLRRIWRRWCQDEAEIARLQLA